MRGSPLIRFILLTIALIATGMGLLRVTSAQMMADAPVAPAMLRPVATALVPFQLILSAPAGEVKIDAGKSVTALAAEVSPIIGKLELDEANPHVSLIVRWKNPAVAGEHRFAKLTLEAPGKDTFTHVFDADGDVDDFLELPLPPAK